MSQTTKRALETSLKKLLLKKPINKITISDITDDCGVNRMTFYYHFTDIYDLARWACMEDAEQAIANNKTYDTWQQGFLNIFNAVLENKPFIKNVYHALDREQIENYLNTQTHELLMGVIEEQATGMFISEKDKEFIADFFKYAFNGIMLKWIADNMKEDPKYIVDRVSTLIHGDISYALNAFRKDKSLSNDKK